MRVLRVCSFPRERVFVGPRSESGDSDMKVTAALITATCLTVVGVAPAFADAREDAAKELREEMAVRTYPNCWAPSYTARGPCGDTGACQAAKDAINSLQTDLGDPATQKDGAYRWFRYVNSRTQYVL